MHTYENQWYQTKILTVMESLIIAYDKNMHWIYPDLNSVLSKKFHFLWNGPTMIWEGLFSYSSTKNTVDQEQLNWHFSSATAFVISIRKKQACSWVINLRWRSYAKCQAWTANQNESISCRQRFMEKAESINGSAKNISFNYCWL